MPYHTPCIHPGDFNVKLPSLEDDDELAGGASSEKPADYPRPIHWQIIMIRAAHSSYALHQSIRTGTWTDMNAAALVFQTDERIAKIISDLPPWFSPEEDEGSISQWSEAEFPWIKTQRARTYLMAYETRINIYSLLLSLSPDAGDSLSRAQYIHLASSRTTLQLSLNLTEEVAKSWYDVHC